MRVKSEFITKVDDITFAEEYNFDIDDQLKIRLSGFIKYKKEGRQKKFREILKYDPCFTRSNTIDLPTIMNIFKNDPEKLTTIKINIIEAVATAIKINLNSYFVFKG